MKTKLDYMRGFYNGRPYPVLAASLILLGNATGHEVPFAAALLLSMVPACLICHDLRFALMPAMCAVFTVSGKTYAPNDTGYAERYLRPEVLISLAAVAALFVAALLYFLIRNRKTVNSLPQKGQWLGLLIFCAALLANGLFFAAYDPKNLFFGALTSAVLLAVYFLFAFYMDVKKDVFDHVLFCLALAGMLICAELVAAYFTTVRFEEGEIVKGSVVLGWGVWTSIGGMLTFLLPAHFYFAASHKHGWIGLVTGFFQYFCIFLSQSRGALLLGSGILLLCLVCLLCKGQNRKRNRLIILVLLVLGCAAAVLIYDKLISLLQNFLSMGFADNGRYALWSTGIESFLSHPIFGTGFYDCYVPEAHEGWEMPVYPYFYHNTVIQLLAATGAVGLAAYLYHRFCTLRAVLRRPNAQKAFFGLCILGLVLCSLIDVLFFKTYPSVFYAVILLMLDRRDEITEWY